MRIILFLLFGVLFSFETFALCVSSSEAELYEKPDPQSRVVWKVFRYMPFKEVNRLNDWIQVEDLDGKRAWISDRLVSDSVDCAVIKDEFANLRRGPGTNFPKAKAGRGDKYLSFKLLKLQDEWALLKDTQGEELWVSADLLWKSKK